MADLRVHLSFVATRYRQVVDRSCRSAPPERKTAVRSAVDVHRFQARMTGIPTVEAQSRRSRSLNGERVSRLQLTRLRSLLYS